MKILKSILITGLSIALLAYLLPTVSYQNLTALILASIVLTLLNKIVKPILKILFLPVNIVTLGLFSWVINLALLALATYLVPGFQIKAMVLFGQPIGWLGSLFITSFLIAIAQSFIGLFIK